MEQSEQEIVISDLTILERKFENMEEQILEQSEQEIVISDLTILERKFENMEEQILEQSEQEIVISDFIPDIKYKVFQFNEIDEFVDYIYDLGSLISTDVECTNLRIWEGRFRLGGIGFSNEENGCYLVVNSVESKNELDDSTINKIRNLFEWLQKDHTILVYNQVYEKQVFDRFFGIKLNVFDVFIMMTCLGKRASLKDNSQNYIGAAKWEDDTQLWTSSFVKALKKFRIGDNGKTNKAYNTLVKELDAGITDIYQTINLFKTKELTSCFNNMKLLLQKYYDEENVNILLTKTLEELRYRVDIGLIEEDYTFIPTNIVSIYCIYDNINTVKLYKMFQTDFEFDGLDKAYESYSKQADLSVIFEKNGCIWNEEVAKEKVLSLKNDVISLYKELFLIPEVSKSLELTDNDLFTINTTMDLDILETYFTPRSYKKARIMLNAVLVTEQFRFALFIEAAKKIREYNKSRFKAIGKLIDKDYSESGDIISTMEKLKQDLLDETIKLHGVDSDILLSFMGEQFEITEYRIEHQQEYKKLFVDYFGVDIENYKQYKESIPEFYFFMIFFLLKKSLKELSGFNGVLGRDTCFKIDKSNIDCYQENYFRTNMTDQFYFYKMRYNPMGALTKRWMSSFHTIASGSDLRYCINPHFDKDGLVLHWDLSQAEVRVLAYLINEENLLSAYEQGLDVHRYNAGKVFNKPMEQVTDTERFLAKSITFGLLYRKSPEAFVRDGVFKHIKEANEFFDLFFTSYPKIKKYFNDCDTQVLELDGIKTFYGDLIPLKFDHSSEYEVAEAQRAGTNYPIQHYSSCMTALTINKLDEILNNQGINVKSFGFTHDSSDMSISAKDFIYIVNNLRKLVIDITKEQSGVPVDIDFSVGVSLGEQVVVKITNEPNLFKIEGDKVAIDKLIKSLNRFYDTIFEITSSEENYISYKDLFDKGAFNSRVGKSETIVKGKLFLKIVENKLDKTLKV